MKHQSLYPFKQRLHPEHIQDDDMHLQRLDNNNNSNNNNNSHRRQLKSGTKRPLDNARKV